MELAFTPPSGKVIRNPAQDVLHDLIFFKGDDYWQIGSGTGSLEARDGPLFDENGSQVFPANRLGLSFKDPYGFLLTFFAHDARSDELAVAISSKDYSQTVTIFAGDDWTVPRAFFVSRDKAWKAVQEFIQQGERPAFLTWVKIADQKWDSGW